MILFQREQGGCYRLNLCTCQEPNSAKFDKFNTRPNFTFLTSACVDGLAGVLVELTALVHRLVRN